MVYSQMMSVLFIEKYIFAVMTAGALVYFFTSILELKHGGDYEGLKHAKHSAFVALTALVFILVGWGVVHMVLVTVV